MKALFCHVISFKTVDADHNSGDKLNWKFNFAT